MIWTKQQDQLLLSNWETKTTHELCKILPDRTYNAIKARLNHLGIVRRPDIGLDRSFFSKVTTKEKAYLLGVLEAEGCVGKNKVALGLGQRDLSWLIQLRNLTGSRATIGENWSQYGKSYRVEFCSKQWVGDLADLQFRTGQLPPLPKKLMPYYVKGLFDGDGTICWDKHNACYISLFYGDELLMKEIEAWLKKKHVACNTTNQGPTCWNVKMHRLATIQLGHVIPKGKSYMLNRKCHMLQNADQINWLPKQERQQRYVELDGIELHQFEGEE